MTTRHVTALIVLSALLCTRVAVAATRVNVGVYNFPPVAEVTESGTIGAKDIEALLKPMIRDGSYARLVKQHHLRLPEGGLFTP